MKRMNHCTNCNYYEDVTYAAMVPLRAPITSCMNLANIEHYIPRDDMVSICRGCGTPSIVDQQFQNIIAFEVEPFVAKHLQRSTIEQLKREICVGGKVYKLFGIIERQPAIRHFVSHVKRNNGVWQTINDLLIEVN